MRQDLARLIGQKPTIFDEWPKSPIDEDAEEEYVVGMNETRRLRLQMLLAVNPWGIPSLAFGDAYYRMFGRPLDIKNLGFEHLSEMISSLPDIFTVQEPDELTALMFPDFPHDKILHDARLGLDFDRPNFDGQVDKNRPDPNVLINHAWLNRDDEFPHDVVLAGERYSELILPMTSANVPGTRGVHQVLICSAANPTRVHINVKSESFDKIDKLSGHITQYFCQSEYQIEAYSVPDEFIYPGFPCLFYQQDQRSWERCEIVSRGVNNNKVVIETVDAGEELVVNPIFLYLIPRAFFEVPKQCLTVSLIGMKPKRSNGSWGSRVGKRLRCFSNRYYWLDCLLMDIKKSIPDNGPDMGSELVTVVDTTISNDDKESSSASIKKRPYRQPQFEAILCDRNDDEMNIYIDEILALETYAAHDESRIDEIRSVREKLDQVLETVPRSMNPLINKLSSLQL